MQWSVGQSPVHGPGPGPSAGAGPGPGPGSVHGHPVYHSVSAPSVTVPSRPAAGSVLGHMAVLGHTGYPGLATYHGQQQGHPPWGVALSVARETWIPQAGPPPHALWCRTLVAGTRRCSHSYEPSCPLAQLHQIRWLGDAVYSTRTQSLGQGFAVSACRRRSGRHGRHGCRGCWGCWLRWGHRGRRALVGTEEAMWLAARPAYGGGLSGHRDAPPRPTSRDLDTPLSRLPSRPRSWRPNNLAGDDPETPLQTEEPTTTDTAAAPRETSRYRQTYWPGRNGPRRPVGPCKRKPMDYVRRCYAPTSGTAS